MKELLLVYLWMLAVAIAGCTTTSMRQFDISNPNDRKAIEEIPRAESIELITTGGDTLSISQVRVEGGSLRFMTPLPDTVISGQALFFPKGLPVDSVASLRRQTRKVNAGPTVALVSLAFVVLVVVLAQMTFTELEEGLFE